MDPTEEPPQGDESAPVAPVRMRKLKKKQSMSDLEGDSSAPSPTSPQQQSSSTAALEDLLKRCSQIEASTPASTPSKGLSRRSTASEVGDSNPSSEEEEEEGDGDAVTWVEQDAAPQAEEDLSEDVGPLDFFFEAWFLKRAEKIGQSHRRYFMLDGNMLHYYAGKKPEGGGQTHKGKVVITAETEVVYLGNELTLRMPARTWQLRADSAKDSRHLKTVLAVVIEAMRAAGSDARPDDAFHGAYDYAVKKGLKVKEAPKQLFAHNTAGAGGSFLRRLSVTSIRPKSWFDKGSSSNGGGGASAPTTPSGGSNKKMVIGSPTNVEHVSTATSHIASPLVSGIPIENPDTSPVAPSRRNSKGASASSGSSATPVRAAPPPPRPPPYRGSRQPSFDEALAEVDEKPKITVSEPTFAAVAPVVIGSRVPVVIRRCVEYICQPQVLMEEGLFRIPGSQVQVNRIEEALENDEDIDLSTVSEPSVVCTLLKSQLRAEALPASADDSRRLVEAVELKADLPTRVDAVIEIIDAMPSIRAETLEALMRMFKLVSGTKGTLMTVENLGLAVGTTLFPGVSVQRCTSILAFLVGHLEGIFAKHPTDSEGAEEGAFDGEDVIEEEEEEESTSPKDTTRRF